MSSEGASEAAVVKQQQAKGSKQPAKMDGAKAKAAGVAAGAKSDAKSPEKKKKKANKMAMDIRSFFVVQPKSK